MFMVKKEQFGIPIPKTKANSVFAFELATDGHLFVRPVIRRFFVDEFGCWREVWVRGRIMYRASSSEVRTRPPKLCVLYKLVNFKYVCMCIYGVFMCSMIITCVLLYEHCHEYVYVCTNRVDECRRCLVV